MKGPLVERPVVMWPILDRAVVNFTGREANVNHCVRVNDEGASRGGVNSVEATSGVVDDEVTRDRGVNSGRANG